MRKVIFLGVLNRQVNDSPNYDHKLTKEMVIIRHFQLIVVFPTHGAPGVTNAGFGFTARLDHFLHHGPLAFTVEL